MFNKKTAASDETAVQPFYLKRFFLMGDRIQLRLIKQHLRPALFEYGILMFEAHQRHLPEIDQRTILGLMNESSITGTLIINIEPRISI